MADLLTLRSCQHIRASLVVANLVAYYAGSDIDVRLAVDVKLLAEVLGVPGACTVSSPACAVVAIVISTSGGTAGGHVTLVQERIEGVAGLGADVG